MESQWLNRPQVLLGVNPISSTGQSWWVQIKNIKLHIVTDIKVTFNSMFGFRISKFGWGEGFFYYTMKRHSLAVPGEDLVRLFCTKEPATIVLATVNWFPIWHRFDITFLHRSVLTSLGTPQEYIGTEESSLQFNISKVQIKNIKLHIVTDIKVNFNSMLGFRISIFGWGVGYFSKQWNSSDVMPQ